MSTSTKQQQQPIKKLVPQHSISNSSNAGTQKPLHKIVLLPSQSLGHSRQNSSGSASVGASNGSLGTFQDSLNSFGLAANTAAGCGGLQSQGGSSSTNYIFFGKQITIPSNPQSAIQSARGGGTAAQSTQLSASVSSSTETLLKPSAALQSKAMISAQSTAEKQKPVFFKDFKKPPSTENLSQNPSSATGGGAINTQTLYMHSNHHKRNSSSGCASSSSSGSSGRENNKPPINRQQSTTQPTSQLIHIQRHNSQQNSTSANPSQGNVILSSQQMKIQKYNKIKNEMGNNPTPQVINSKRVSPINAGPTTQGQQLNQVPHSKKLSQETTKETIDQEKAALNIAQSQLYQKLSGQIKTTENSHHQQVYSQKHHIGSIVSNKQPNLLKTSQMTKNLLMSTSNQGNSTQGYVPSHKDMSNHNVLKDQQKAQTLKITVNNLLNSKVSTGGTAGVTQGGGDLSARLLSKAQSLNNHLQKSVVGSHQYPSRQVVNYSNSGSNQGVYPNDSLKTGSFSGLSINQKGHQQQVQLAVNKQPAANSNLSSALTTSKMMMALHKKCNSIVTTPIAASAGNSGAFSFQPSKIQEKLAQTGESDQNTRKDDEKAMIPDPPSTVRHNNNKHQFPSHQIPSQQQNLLASSASTVVLSMTTSQMSAQQPVEFFDENVQINHVRQITPRGQLQEGSQVGATDNKKMVLQPNNPLLMVQNFFDKSTRPGSKGSKIISGQVSAGVQSPQHHPNKENLIQFNIKPETSLLPKNHQAHLLLHKRTTSVVTTDVDMQVEVLEKRRMSYENNKRASLSKMPLNQQVAQVNNNASIERIQTQQKAAHLDKTPPQNTQDNQNIEQYGGLSHKLAKAHEEFSNRKLGRKNAKEEIVQSIGIILRKKKGLSTDIEVLEKDPTHQLTLQHLRDFLTYLEDKKIINCENLASNEQEMSNLINDLVKLDFNKFQTPNISLAPQSLNPTPHIHVSASKQKRMSQEAQQNRRASLDLIKDRQPTLLSPPDEDERRVPNGAQSHLMSPIQPRLLQQKSDNNSLVQFPKQKIESDGYVCFYSPINLNGDGNVVNTNIQIFQPPQTSQFNPGPLKNQSGIPTAQKLNYIGHKVFSQPVSQVHSTEKEPLINPAHDKIQKIKPPNFPQGINQVTQGGSIIPAFQSSSQNQQLILIAQSAQVPSNNHKKNHKRVYSIGSNHELENQRANLNHTPNDRAGVNPVINNPQPFYQNKMGFGFAGMPEQYQPGAYQQHVMPESNGLLFQDTDILDMGIQGMQVEIDNSKATHYHARKRSMYVQQANEGKEILIMGYPQARQNMMLRDQHQRSQEQLIKGLDDALCQPDDVALLCSNKPRPNHRRAATNFISSGVGYQEVNDIRTLQPLNDHFFPSSRSGSLDQLVSSDELREERDKLIAYIKHFTYSPRPEIPITSVDYYKFVKLIGKGAFGKVTLGVHKLTGKIVAIKTVDKTLMKDDYQKKKVLQEVQILKKVRHANVIRLLEVFESPKHLLMVMEYAGGGDLLQFVKKRRRLEESEARRIFKQVVFGIAHCHCRSVLHRDIKLDNILLDRDGDVKICDFGVSRVIQKHQKISEQCGTPAYIAPEIISDGGYQGFAADIWSLGVLLFAMVCGTVPFKAQSMHELHDLIINGRFDFPASLQSQLSCEVKDLISRMLIVNPLHRISISEILKHPWIQLFDSILDDNQEYQMDGDITLHSFDAQNAVLQQQENKQLTINELLSSVNVDNLYKSGLKAKQRLSYSDYCAITQDHATMHINDEVLQRMETEMGMPQRLIKDHLNRGDLNHATATYQLIVLS